MASAEFAEQPDISETATEEEAMLRKGIVALMITVMSVGSIQADDGPKSNRLMDFFRGPSIGRPGQKLVRTPTSAPKATTGGVTHAVVEDVEKEVPEIRQTSSRPEPPQLQPAETAPQPMPIQYAQVASDNGAVPMQQASNSDVVWTQPQQIVFGGPSPFQFASSGAYVQAASPVAMPGQYMGPAGGLYPSPRPGVPANVGASAITNPAFHPHEMMHKHRYKAMYGPFYHKVNGCWIVTPFGVWSKENWKLQGTTVDVKYKSHISPFAFFSRPVIR